MISLNKQSALWASIILYIVSDVESVAADVGLSGRPATRTTPRGSLVNVLEDVLPELDAVERANLHALWDNYSPTNMRVGVATRSYNCFSYAFSDAGCLMSRYEPYLWDQSYRWFYSGFGYNPWWHPQILNAGNDPTILVYATYDPVMGGGVHAADYHGNGWAVSKWGFAGLYHHLIQDTPYYPSWWAYERNW